VAKISQLNEAEWEKWVKTRPPVVRAVCEKLPPDRLYRLKSTGARVTLYSYSEDGTVTVDISGTYNALVFERQVFGISPDDLEECDLPVEGEPLGVLLQTEEEIDACIDLIRASPTVSEGQK
jgi:hypothetical protein